MTSTHHRYSLPAPPQNSQRLPSLKDLNFQYRPPANGVSQPPPQTELVGQQQQQEHVRHPPAWARSNPPPNPSAPSLQSLPHQQQHTPPLSAGHEVTPKVEYSAKHENGGYAHPGIPLSAQSTSGPSPVAIANLRNDEIPHSPNQPTQVKRRTHPDPIPTREPHYVTPSYQYSVPPIAAYPSLAGPHSSQPAPPPPPPPAPHEQIHHHSIPPGYPTYQQHQYMQPRQPVMHQQHPSHPQANHSNPYPSPGPPPSAPPPQGPWSQPPQHAPPPPTHQQPPPQQQQQQQQHHVQQHPSHIPSHHQPPPPSIPANPSYAVPQHHLQPAPPPPQQIQHVPHPQQQQQQQPPHQPPPQQQQQQQQPPPPPPSHQFQQPHQQQQQHQHQHPQQQHPQQQHQQQHQQQQHQVSYGRTTAIVPTSIDTRSVYPPPPPPPPPPNEPERTSLPRPHDVMLDITERCSVLYNFAFRYADMQRHVVHPTPLPQPTQAELEDMLRLAQDLVRLLEETKRATNGPEVEQSIRMSVSAPEPMQESPDDIRPPKRPWEDISQDDPVVVVSAEQNSFAEQPQPQQQQQQQPQPSYATGDSSAKPQTTAEQDMELIRTKRATTTASANGPPGQPKSKYRKRSRATPPGKCHSCNIKETPEWRRGPDGARTLCNACGLHYAKLMRKRDKSLNGEMQHIDMETLRASARAAEIADKPARSGKQTNGKAQHQQQQQGSEPASPVEKHQTAQQQQQQQQHHQGSFQLMSMMAPAPPTEVQQQQQQQQQGSAAGDSGRGNVNVNGSGSGQQQPTTGGAGGMAPPPTVPLPPWSTSGAGGSAGRVYVAAPEHLQHQSFMRGSQHSAPSR